MSLPGSGFKMDISGNGRDLEGFLLLRSLLGVALWNSGGREI
jgi:hypothetical protein